jgi:hypothetical protein
VESRIDFLVDTVFLLDDVIKEIEVWNSEELVLMIKNCMPLCPRSSGVHRIRKVDWLNLTKFRKVCGEL